jgi:predicted ABC-type ATPase
MKRFIFESWLFHKIFGDLIEERENNGFVTALQMQLLDEVTRPLTKIDIWNLARCFNVDERLSDRLRAFDGLR